MSLESDAENGAVGGLIYNLDSGERAVFHRKDVYLFGTWYDLFDFFPKNQHRITGFYHFPSSFFVALQKWT